MSYFKRKRIEPELHDVLWYTSPDMYCMYKWGSEKTFYRHKQQWKIITIYIPIYKKWEHFAYKRIYLNKEDIKTFIQ